MVTTQPVKKPAGSILIATVTKVEARAILETFSQASGKESARQIIGDKTYYDLGVHGGVPVFMVQSEMGAATPGGALLTIRKAIQELCPQAVIMCGIAFGLHQDGQRLGDILIAKQIQSYEFRKMDYLRGQIVRGDRVTASERLLDRFRSGDNHWQEEAQTHFGLVLSGEKLVNDPGFKNSLLKEEPEAIGGEMEGAGLYAAAREAKVDWILVKAICDWADGYKSDDPQSLAAHNAAQFVLHVLLLGGWERPGQNKLSNQNIDEITQQKTKELSEKSSVFFSKPDSDTEQLQFMNNPFYHGNPVPINLFLGRKSEIRRITSRINTHGASIAITGDPHSGKSSLLQYMHAPELRKELYNTCKKRLFFSFIDVHSLEHQLDQAKFWERVLWQWYEHVVVPDPDSALAMAYQTCRKNGFGPFVLERLFAKIYETEQRIIVMLDEFDVLLNHPILNTHEFFGNLRALTTRGKGVLTLIIASRRSLTDLHAATQDFIIGSPYFNFFEEISLGPFTDKDILDLFGKAGDRFLLTERNFITDAAGAHPYLLQAAASSLWEIYNDGEKNPISRIRKLQEHLSDIFVPMWDNNWLFWSPMMRMAITIVALNQNPDLLIQRKSPTQPLLQNIDYFEQELHILKKRGTIIEDVNNPCGWRIRHTALLWWLGKQLILFKNEESFKQWIHIDECDEIVAETGQQQTGEIEKNVISIFNESIFEGIRPSNEPKNDIHILHLSDIHLGTEADAYTYLRDLESDLRVELDINKLEYLVISGDIANLSTREEYDAAYVMFNKLVKAFEIKRDHLIIAPGNHDLNWDLSGEAYEFIPRHKLPKDLEEAKIILLSDPAGHKMGGLKCNKEKHSERFKYFAQFYEKLTGSSYPGKHAEQGMLHNFPEHRMQIFSLNSNWEIDHYHTKTSISQAAINHNHAELLNKTYKNWLKIGVWHHPVTDREQIKDTGFLAQLAQYGFQIGMHGHVHETQNNFFRYDDSHGMHIIGAGTFGAPLHERTENVPLQYNLLTFDSKLRTEIIVRTRKKEKPTGIWEADARWGDKGRKPKPEYTIKLRR